MKTDKIQQMGKGGEEDMKQSIFDDLYSKEDGYGAGSSHAITGYKRVKKIEAPPEHEEAFGKRERHLDTFITLVHEDYVPISIEVCCWEEHLMDDAYGDTKLTATLDPKTGEVSSEIPGVNNLEDYLRLVYIARQCEVVRDDS